MSDAPRATTDAVRPIIRRHSLVFVALFLVYFFTLQLGYNHGRDGAVARFFIETLTVKPSVWTINLLTPREAVSAEAHRLVSPHGRLSVLNGCEGTEAMFMLGAAILAFAAPWRHKLAGALAGLALVYALNQARIVALYYTWRYEPDWFNALHGVTGPTLIILGATLFFMGWAQRARGADARPTGA